MEDADNYKVLEHPIYWYYSITDSFQVMLAWVLEHPIYWYYLIAPAFFVAKRKVLEHPIYWYYLIQGSRHHWIVRFLSIPFIGIIWSIEVKIMSDFSSWASHLLVLFDRKTSMHNCRYVLEHPIYWYYLIVLRCRTAWQDVLEHPIYWYYLISGNSELINKAVLEHPIYWYYLIRYSVFSHFITFLSIPFIGIIWSVATKYVRRSWFLSIPFIGIIWS